MNRLLAAGSAWLALSASASAPSDILSDAEATAAAIVQVTIRRSIVIRVPDRDARVPAASRLPSRWRESVGPRCISARSIAGAFPSASSVDLLLTDNRRVRAHLGQRCGGLDYYRGLYVDATPDGRICAGRDEVRSRMGGQCEITEFRLLQPVRR